jgi:hypothetical protein
MMTGIERIKGALRELLREREIIARCELLNRTYEFVRDAALDSMEVEELREMVGERIAPGIFACMMNDSSILDLPKLDTYTQMNGRIFHFIHTQRYSEQDFDNAYRRFVTSLPELKAILRQNLRDLLVDFMSEAGYHLAEESPECLSFEAGENWISALIFTSIRSVDLNKCRSDEECVILTPSSEGLDPFVQFFRQIGQAAEDAGVQIWVANMEKGTIDPFIGYTTDMDIYGQFKNPRMAEMVRTHWKK